MFKITSLVPGDAFYISSCDRLHHYLHSDGLIRRNVEYFDSKADAQEILDKFYPKPKHVWKHGDVFKNASGKWIYLEPFSGNIVVRLNGPGHSGTPECQLTDAKFLFNLKDIM